MAFVKNPDHVVDSMIQAGAQKEKLSIRDLLIRRALAGAILGFATNVAIFSRGWRLWVQFYFQLANEYTKS